MLLHQQVSLEKKSKVKKSLSVSATFMPMTAVREKAVENAKVGKYGENPGTSTRTGEDDKNPGSNLAQGLFIQYPITFWKKFILILFDQGSAINAVYLIFA